MSKEFEDIKRGLLEAIEYEKGNLSTRKKTISIVPLKHYSSSKLKSIRKSTHLSQSLFARVMGVSNKTIEAWESGRNHPDGAATRLLSLIEKNPNFPYDEKIIEKRESYTKKTK